ncbi:Rpn family recombination-promoting nuclease/putative transposase [Limosilactobacillus kribbianus]|uniref:Rpn family recombination-promoting nuclease/putative transposase n=1 Tax=Limosilactobacillus kribbianus TaxID=2982695 RepID=UPI002263D4F5
MQFKEATDKWNQLTIADDRMFSMVMEDEQICLELLRRIFPKLPIRQVKRVAIQKQVNTPLDARTIRFDVYVRDDRQRTYVIEMRVANRHNLPYWLRYYQSQMDQELLHPGEGDEKLRERSTYVIFFCDFDYYKRGLPEYDFEWRCLQDLELPAGTRQLLIVFNARAKDFRNKIGIEGFLRLMHNQVTPGDQLVERISQKMMRIKQDPERRRNFMKYELDLIDARSEGVKKELKLQPRC